MSSSDEDAPLVMRRGSGRPPLAIESSSDEDVPLNARGKLGLISTYESSKAKSSKQKHSTNEEEQSSDDNVPLAARSRLKRSGPGAKEEPMAESSEEEESSDDDIPLIARRRGKTEAVKEEHKMEEEVVSRLKRKKTPQKATTGTGGDQKTSAKKRKINAAADNQQKSKVAKVKAVKMAKAKEAEKKKTENAKRKGQKKSVKTKTAVDKESPRAARQFDLPGQRKETPPENDPSRLFYESMYHEKLSLKKPSELAEAWMLRHGLLDAKRAQRVVQRLAKKA